jgi:hypothetical protein
MMGELKIDQQSDIGRSANGTGLPISRFHGGYQGV